MFSLVRVFSDQEGESHFEEVEIPLTDKGSVGYLSEGISAGHVIFREVDPGYDWDFHVAPERQFIVLLDGEIEIETSLGDKRIFRPGEILLMEDTTGKGHRTRNVRPVRRRSIFITLPD
jgi:hypothetical protein